MWITNGPDADLIVVYAKTEPEAGSRGITTFIVEREFGYTTAQKLDKLGMRGSNTGEMVFQNVEVPENILASSPRRGGFDERPRLRARHPVRRPHRHHARLHGRGVLHIHDRKQFGQAIGEFELMQGKVADMYVDDECDVRAYVYAVGKLAIVARPRARRRRRDPLRRRKGDLMALEANWVLGGNGYTNDIR